MSENITKIVLKNKLLQPLVDVLECQMSGASARARNRFIEVVGRQLNAIDKERVKMYSEVALKDDKGVAKTKTIVNPKDGTPLKVFDLSPEATDKVQVEFAKYLEEEFVIDVLPSNKFDVEVVTKAILGTTKEFDLTAGASYDLIAIEFEKLKCQKE